MPPVPTTADTDRRATEHPYGGHQQQQANIKMEQSPIQRQGPSSRISSVLETPDRRGSDADYSHYNSDEILAVSPRSKPDIGRPKERRPHATRRRVVQSCSECRRRKIKCDKKFPCGPCVLRSDEDRCHEVGMAEKNVVSNTNLASTSDLAQLAHRIDALEASLVKSGALLPSDLDQFLKSSEPSGDHLIQDRGARQTTRSRSESRVRTGLDDDDEDTEGAARVLEHLAFGRSRLDGNRAMPHFGARTHSAISGYSFLENTQTYPTNINFPEVVPLKRPDDEGTILKDPKDLPAFNTGRHISEEERERRTTELLELLGPSDVVGIFFRKTDLVLKLLVKVLPSQEIGEALVKVYLDKVDWLHRCMHVPTFMKMCRRIWALDRSRVVHEIPLGQVALYLTVLLLGLIFMDNDEVSRYFTPFEIQTLPDMWYNSVRSAMWAADFMACHTLETVQGVILLIVFMKNRDRSDAAWAMLGAIIKMAQGLGLSRLGSEQHPLECKELPLWKSLVNREVGRRTWWNLVVLDWALAPAYNFACCISPDQIKTALPANIEDDDLADDKPFQPKPTSVYTRMSFQLARVRFAEIGHRQICAANSALNSQPPYSFTLNVDGELRRAMMDLPSFYQPDPTHRGPASSDPEDQVQFYERIMLNLAVHSRVLRLHRPWLSKGYTDPKFSYSKEQCIRAARASLRMMGNHNQSASFLEKWWLPLFYVSVSGLVVIIDLLRTPKRDMHSSETEQKMQEVRSALDQMRQIADVSHPSRAAVKVLDLLMLEVEERRKPRTLGKRKASDGDNIIEDEDHALQRAVKRLIRQAQFEADSPTVSTHSGSPISGHSPQPKSSREMDMRIFSDTPRDRPVFDAYPLPQLEAPTQEQAQTQTGNNDSTNGLAPPDQQQKMSGGSGLPSPFNFPVDSSMDGNFTMDTNMFAGPAPSEPQLNPAVESMLSSYFPRQPDQMMQGNGYMPENNGMQTQAAPDDFLSKVFTFGWDTAANNNNTTSNNMNTGGNNFGTANANGQFGGQQGNGQNGDMGGMNGSAPLSFGAWSSHSWMA